MAVQVGSRLGPYDVTALIGEADLVLSYNQDRRRRNEMPKNLGVSMTTTTSRTFAMSCAAAVVTTLAIPIAGRAQAPEPPMSAEDCPVTFTEDVAPIVFDHCVSCHQPDGVAPMSLTTYEEVRPWARAIRQAVVTRAMPPWKADQGDVAFLGDRRLSEASITTLTRWVDAGAPQGDPDQLPALPSLGETWSLGEPDLVVRMPQAFPVPAVSQPVLGCE